MKKNSKRHLIVLLDAHAIIHRAYHALPDFASSKGIPTGALYGLSTMLMGIIEKFNPDYLIACYDLPQPTYRHEAYEAYKAGRRKTDPALVEQLKSSRKLFEAFGVPMYDKGGFEADDMLGTIVEQVLKNQAKCETTNEDGTITTKKCGDEMDIMIASGDMDTLQLVVGDRVKVFTLKKGIKDTVIYNEEGVLNRFGFLPALLPDYKGLRGDPSDNIIGIAGIGEKTATILLTKFGGIEDIYKTLKKSPEKLKEAGVTDRMFELLKNGEEEAEFSKMLATIRRDAPIDFVVPLKTWRETFQEAPVEAFFREMEFRSLIMRIKQVAIKIAGKAEAGKAIGQKNKEDSPASRATTVSSDAQQGSLSEEILSQNVSPQKKKELTIKLWVIDSNMTNPSLEDVLEYAGTANIEEAEEFLNKKLKENDLEEVYEKLEKPLIPVIFEMQRVGVRIDKGFFKELSKKYHGELEKLEKSIWKEAGAEFNISSPKQLGEILFDKMAIEPDKGVRMKKTAGGARSTKESELEKMKGSHPIIELILHYRELSKLLSTYVDPLPTLAGPDSRLHAEFIQAGSATGRFSSQNPNLQNIPIKTDLGRQVRHGFVAEKGFKLVSFDYSQIELRIAAMLSLDENMVEIFKEGTDIHTGVAARVFEVSESEVTKDMRRQAKVINFGILFGMGVNALKMNLGSTRADAQTFLEKYFKTFEGLAVYLERVKAEAKRDGYTKTFYGRKRYFEGFRSPLPFIRASAERMAINAPIQGTEADVVKLAMIRANDLIIKKGWQDDVRLLMQVHDELVFEIKEEKVKEVAKEIRKVMEDVMTLEESKGVPIVTSANVGDNWGEMEEIES